MMKKLVVHRDLKPQNIMLHLPNTSLEILKLTTKEEKLKFFS